MIVVVVVMRYGAPMSAVKEDVKQCLACWRTAVTSEAPERWALSFWAGGAHARSILHHQCASYNSHTPNVYIPFTSENRQLLPPPPTPTFEDVCIDGNRREMTMPFQDQTPTNDKLQHKFLMETLHQRTWLRWGSHWLKLTF